MFSPIDSIDLFAISDDFTSCRYLLDAEQGSDWVQPAAAPEFCASFLLRDASQFEWDAQQQQRSQSIEASANKQSELAGADREADQSIAAFTS